MKTRERSAAGDGSGRQSVPAPGLGAPLSGERLPTAPRERKPALAALAVLLILVGALGATVMVMRAGDKISVVEIVDPVAAGNAITEGSIREVMVSEVSEDPDITFIKWGQRKDLLDNWQAATNLMPHSVLTFTMLTRKSDALPAGKSIVGLTLKEGQYPYNLAPGSTVAAYRVGDDAAKAPDSSSGSGNSSGGADTLISDHLVIRDKSSSAGGLGGGGDISFTVVVDNADAAQLTAAAHADEVALALVSPRSS